MHITVQRKVRHCARFARKQLATAAMGVACLLMDFTVALLVTSDLYYSLQPAFFVCGSQVLVLKAILKIPKPSPFREATTSVCPQVMSILHCTCLVCTSRGDLSKDCYRQGNYGNEVRILQIQGSPHIVWKILMKSGLMSQSNAGATKDALV